MELGMYTFGEVTHDPVTGRQLDAADRMRQLVEEMELADQVGLYGTQVAPRVRAEIESRRATAPSQ